MGTNYAKGMGTEYGRMKQAAISYIKNALDGHAGKIECKEYPCCLVWCESMESGVNDPLTNDLPRYAVIGIETGEIQWTELSGMLDDAQREMIEASASMCACNMGGFVHYTIGTTLI